MEKASKKEFMLLSKYTKNLPQLCILRFKFGIYPKKDLEWDW